jgi:hypothetical protein
VASASAVTFPTQWIADAGREPPLGTDDFLHLPAKRGRSLSRELLEPVAHIQIRLIHGDLLDLPAECREPGHNLSRLVAVGIHSGADKNSIRAQPLGRSRRHRGPHAECPRFIARRANHTPAVGRSPDNDRPALEPRIIALFHRCIERIHIEVEDHARHFWRRGLAKCRETPGK